MDAKILHKETGFTIIELLFVILIIGVIMSILVISWHSQAPISELNNKILQLSMSMEYCQTKAILTGNKWFIQFDTAAQNYIVVNDDGWLGTITEVDMWGKKWPARNFFVGSNDFSEDSRNNGIVDSNEFDKGPFYLGAGQKFLDATNVTRITFNPEGDCYNDAGLEDADIWIANQEYLSIYQGDINNGTADQRKFRQGIRVCSLTGNIETVNN
ncbi:MAG: hypothetical protein A2161_12385 [Candidatus Schekmanbacteria bacterium RBG_13_48_7]|uniref:General secretion pathway GspH domain-containing protein n=1 Tax=Candidatus Schekmanbacteria bacterium RBG_13_48_7 TaxID=1817878 RepID=A0A1F7RL21_9BACT|nr:MAG: hypothetical protein A2161_12385 [Candidatus Schekmanbacteria bacterium RBG_13_48_7]